MPTYAQLNQTHPSHDAQRIAELCALYEGGKKLEKLYDKLLPQRPRERPERWQLRTKEAEYRNYLGPIIDYFKSMLFVSRPILKAKTPGAAEPTSNLGDYWAKLREDCDGGGTDIDAFFGQILIDAMVTRAGWLFICQPDDGGQAPNDAAEYEQRGLGDIKLERLEPCEVLDWDADEAGRLKFAITHECERPRRGVSSDRSVVVETWRYLTPETIETYRIEWTDKEPPKPDQEIPRIGEPRPNRLGAVPIVCLDMKPALWVANRLHSAQLAHFRKVCAQSWSLASTAYAMPVIKVSDPLEYQKAASGPGYEIVIGPTESYEWAAPPTAHFAAYDAEIKACKDEIFRAAHQMAIGVDNNAAAVGRSADSKQSDAEATRTMLVAFSRVVKETIEYTLDLISRARGEDLEWSVEGLDDFASFDITTFLAQLGAANDAGGIPSKTFKVQALTRVAEAMLQDVDEETRNKIRQEIADGTKDPADEPTEEEKLHAMAARLTAHAQQARAGAGGGEDSEEPSDGGGGGADPGPPQARRGGKKRPPSRNDPALDQ